MLCRAVLCAPQNCALRNLSTIKQCFQIDLSMCDTQAKCDLSVGGLAFPDDTCLLVANNDKAKNSTLTLQMWNFYDCEWMVSDIRHGSNGSASVIYVVHGTMVVAHPVA